MKGRGESPGQKRQKPWDSPTPLSFSWFLGGGVSCNEGLSKAVTGARIDYHSTSRRALMEAEGNS